MIPLYILVVGIGALAVGAVLGYYARQSIAKKKVGTIEAQLQEKISQAKSQAESIVAEAERKASQVLEQAKKEEDRRRQEVLETERLLLKKEHTLEEKIARIDKKEEELSRKEHSVQELEKEADQKRQQIISDLERVAHLTQEEAKNQLLAKVEEEHKRTVAEKMRRLEAEGMESLEKKAREILSLVIQRCAVSQTQEITTTAVPLPSEEIKGRIIGKEGRNIRTLERLTGVELLVDETPETVVISSFDPIRRQIAKLTLEKLIQDGRIQPARIEEMVKKAEEEINKQVKEAGEAAAYETGALGLDPKLLQILGRLRFRTSYSQNVLLHSIEVAHLAGLLAAELGADVNVAKKGALLHDIGKALDHQMEGSHVDIGIKIMEKFGVEKEVIDAMKAHHEEYPYESVEAIIVQTADAISGSRPGARRDTLENYIKRLTELENTATSFEGVEKAYAIQAGREIRVFVNPSKVDDAAAKKLAKDIAHRIQDELKYPGEIKVVLIRENRIVEFAK